MVLLWLIGIVVVTTVILVTYKQRFSRSGKLAAKIPGPKFIPLVGNALDLGRNPLELFNGFLQAANEYGGVVRYWVGSLVHIIDSDPRDIEFFLSSTSILMKTEGYDFLDLWLGTGLISADGGPKWHEHRKMLTPAFHFKILQGFTDVFNKNTNILVKKLKCEVGKPSFDIEPYVSDLTLDVICESAMGTPVNAQLQSHSRFAEAIKEVTRAVMSRMFKPWLFPKLLFDMSSIGKTYSHNLKHILNFVDQVIEKKKKLHEENKLNMDGREKHTEEYDMSKKYAFLDLMLQYRDADSETLSDMDIRDEVNTFMFAGQDTTTSAISFALYELAKHPEIQEKVVEELNEIFSGSDREETYQDLQNMKYLERVIKETLRIYTTVPFIGRQLTHDVTVPSGYTLPEGSMVILFLYKLHHNPEIYTNPEEFNPDNFLQENVQNRGPFAFCPFSAGPRNCIGARHNNICNFVRTVRISQASRNSESPPVLNNKPPREAQVSQYPNTQNKTQITVPGPLGGTDVCFREKVVEELNEIFSGSDREETYQDLQNMKYLERVIKETLRIYTTVPFIGRQLTHDVTVPSGYTLPEGSMVILFLYKLHHNPEIYTNPEEFNPDNFLQENVQNRGPFAFCPFSAGPRNCIGQKFAMLELKSTLSSVLRKYRLFPSESGPDVILTSELVLRSATGVHIHIENR